MKARGITALAAIAALGLTSSSAQGAPIDIVSYDIHDAVKTGFGNWAHQYTGSIESTGSVSIGRSSGTIANYTGGTGTLNDGVIPSNSQFTQLFGNNDEVSPVITLFLDGLHHIDEIILYSMTDTDNQIPGNLDSVGIKIAGIPISVATTQDAGPENEQIKISWPLSQVPTDHIVLENFVASGSYSEFFAIGEIIINGRAIPEPSSIFLIGLGGLSLMRRQTKQ